MSQRRSATGSSLLTYGLLGLVFLIGRRPKQQPIAAAQPVHQSTNSAPGGHGWDNHRWEPFKIAIGAFYALCLQVCLDSVIAYFVRHPVSLQTFPQRIYMKHEQVSVVLQLVTYVIWVSMYFLYNARLYFRLPPKPERLRVSGYANLTASFCIFYFLGATIGAPSRVQLMLIALIIAVDLLFPLHLATLTNLRARVLWIVRDIIELGFVLALLATVTDEQLANIWWVVALFSLIVIQLMISPLEYKIQSRTNSTLTNMSS